MNLPSQKLFIVFLPIIVILGVFSLFSDNKKPTEGSDVKGDAKVVSVANTIVNTADSDEDGVPDWEEVIWKTDPKRVDTFGKPDKEYIEEQRKISKTPTNTASSIASSEDLAAQLFNRYVALEASGELNSATIESMTADIAQKIQLNEKAKPYTLADVKTFKSSDSQRMQAYAATLKRAYAQYSESYTSQFPDTALTPGDPAFTKTATSLSNHYAKFSQELMNIPAPEEAASIHLEYANTVRDSSEGLRLMSELETEPLGGIMGLKKYLDATDAQSVAIGKLTEFLVSNGIINPALELF